MQILDGGIRTALLSGNVFRQRYTVNDDARIIFTANSTDPGTGFRISYRQGSHGNGANNEFIFVFFYSVLTEYTEKRSLLFKMTKFGEFLFVLFKI